VERNTFATSSKASFGQGKNQSIAQQLTSEGNILSLRLKSSPIGDIARTICKLFFAYVANFSLIFALSSAISLKSGFDLFASFTDSMI
jgi:hypothetical protein